MVHLIRKFADDQRGATSIEYAIIASGIAMLIVAVVAGLGTTVQGKFTTVNTALK